MGATGISAPGQSQQRPQHLLGGQTALPGASTLRTPSRVDAQWDGGPCPSHRAGGRWVSRPWWARLCCWQAVVAGSGFPLACSPLPSALTSAKRGCSGHLAAAQHHEPASPPNQILKIGVSVPGTASSSPPARLRYLLSSAQRCRHVTCRRWVWLQHPCTSLHIPACRQLSMVPLAG